MPGALACADLPGGAELAVDLRADHREQQYLLLAGNFVTVGRKEARLVAAHVRTLVSLERELLGS
jgi:hypothetical protein